MSGSRAKDDRRRARQRPLYLINADYVRRSADAVLAVDLSEVPPSHVNQFAVGWMRAAFEQSRIIGNLTNSGHGHAAAPNRRMFWELALRLLWLGDMPQERRDSAVDTMLADSRAIESATDTHMRDMGLDYLVGLGTLDEFEHHPTADPKLREQAKKLTAAVHGTDLNTGVVYRLWREDSTWAHATGYVAGMYAPENGTLMGTGVPPSIDRDLEAHRLAAAAIVVTTGFILNGEGVRSDLAAAASAAYFSVR
jgi:hypothetical protein